MTITPHPFADWFFPQVSVRILRLFRIGLGLVTLALVLVWLPHLHPFFTSEGYVAASYVRETTFYSHLSLFFLTDVPWFVYSCYGLLIASCVAVIVGWGGRISSILMYGLFMSFASRFPLVFYGAIDIVHSLLFFNMFHPGEGYASWKRGGVKERNRTVATWSLRMIQLCLCLVYFFAAFQKLNYGTWRNGTELFNSLSTRFGAFDYYWLLKFPVIINLMTYGSWLTEISFPFLVWNPATRRLALFLVVSMHLGIFVLMNASLFSEVMLVALMSFVSPEDEAWIQKRWTALRRPTLRSKRA